MIIVEKRNSFFWEVTKYLSYEQEGLKNLRAFFQLLVLLTVLISVVLHVPDHECNDYNSNRNVITFKSTETHSET